MAYTLRKVPNKNCYRVVSKYKTKKKYNNRKSRKVLSKCTTKKKALRQIRLLNAIKYGKYKKL